MISLDFNEDKKGLIAEEQKVLDKLIYNINLVIDNTHKDIKRVVQRANSLRKSGNKDEYANIVETNGSIKSATRSLENYNFSKDELYQIRIVLDVTGNGMSFKKEIKVGLHSCTNGSKEYICDWREPACRNFILDSCVTECDGELREINRIKCKPHYKLLFKNKVNHRFEKITDVINTYPMTYNEETIKQLIGTNALSDEYLYKLLEQIKKGNVDTIEVEEQELIYDEFLRELAERRLNSEFQNIVFSIQKKQGEIIQTPFSENIIVQGCAGSGKSMIMFHRLPVIIYDNPNILTRNSIYVITPSKTYISMASNMMQQLEIEDLQMGTLREYYDCCIKRYKLKTKEYGSIVPSELLTKDKEDYVYSEKCIDDIKNCFERVILSMAKLYVPGYDKLSITPKKEIGGNYETRIHNVLLNQDELIKHNAGKIKTINRRFKDLIDLINDFCNDLQNRKSKIIGWFEKEIERINNEIKNKKLKLPTKRNRAFIQAKNARIEELNKEKTVIENDNEYFSALERLSDILMGIIGQYESVDDNAGYNEIYDYIESVSGFLNQYHSISVDVPKLCDKYYNFNSDLLRKYKEIKDEVEQLSNSDFNYLDKDYFLKLIEQNKKLYNFYKEPVKKTYIFILKKIELYKEIKKGIQGYTFSPYLYLQIAFQYMGAHKSQKESLITIDEAQNIAPQEINLIKLINDNKTVFNLFGDEKQHIEGTKGIDNWSEFDVFLKYKKYELQENYRNASQITNYCNKKFNMNMLAINTNGNGVHECDSFIGFSNYLSNKILNEDRVGLSAIIVKNELEAKWIVDEFSRFNDRFHNMVHSESIVHKTKWNIITVSDSKGLEFNTVIVLSADMTSNEKYIACTRALDELFVYNNKVDISKYIESKTEDDTETNDVSEIESQTKEKDNLTLTKSKGKSKENSEVYSYFISQGLKVSDYRDSGGKLWVIGERKKIESIVNNAVTRYKISGKYSYDKNLGINAGWCTKTGK